MLILYPSTVLRQKTFEISETMMRGIVSNGDKFLCSNFSEYSIRRNGVIRDMKQVIEDHKALGLAAIQIGNPHRIIILNTLVYPMTVMYNPVITSFRGHPESDFEGCLSLPGVMVNVPRFPVIDLKYLNESGEPITITLSGVSAIVAQHEIDHLNGVLIIDFNKRKQVNIDYKNVEN